MSVYRLCRRSGHPTGCITGPDVVLDRTDETRRDDIKLRDQFEVVTSLDARQILDKSDTRKAGA